MTDLPEDIERQLASLADKDWDVLVAKLRAPDRAEAFRAAASKYVDGDRLDAVCRCANLAGFVNEAGEIDEAIVGQRLTAMFGPPAGPRLQNFGQFTSPPNMGGPGDAGRAEATRRFDRDAGQQPANTAGAREAQRRFNLTTNERATN